MGTRLLLIATAVVAGIVTYYVGAWQGVDERWPQLAAAIAVGTMLVLFLHLFVGDWKMRSR